MNKKYPKWKGQLQLESITSHPKTAFLIPKVATAIGGIVIGYIIMKLAT